MQAHFLAQQRELTPEHLPWVIGFGILAFVIVWLNDRTKSKASQAKDAANPKAINGFWPTAVFGAGVIGLLVAKSHFGERVVKRWVGYAFAAGFALVLAWFCFQGLRILIAFIMSKYRGLSLIHI